MKTFLSLVLVICGFLACTKEFLESPKLDNSKVYYIEDFASISQTTRDGVKPTITAPVTAVTFNVFDSTQVAVNQRLLIKPTDYLRMGNEVVNFGGIFHGNYIITFYFQNHDTIVKSFAPISYGNHYTIAPNILYNQFDISAQEEFVKLKQTKKFMTYYDISCTKPKTEYVYEISTNTYSGNGAIPPNRCNTYGFSWKLIF